MRSPCCARAASGQPAAAPPSSVMRRVVSLNHLVGAGLERQRHRQSEGLRRLEIDGQLDPGRELDRQICGLGALENPVDVAGPTPIALSLVDAVGCKQAGLDISAFGADGRQPRGERELRDLHTLRKEQTVYRHDDGLRPLLAESIESRSYLAPATHLLRQ